MPHRRDWLRLAAAGAATTALPLPAPADPPGGRPAPLKITGMTVTPIALPDPPILATSGCHGPYFLRTVVRLETDAGIVGVGETRGGRRQVEALVKARPLVVGTNAFAYRGLAGPLRELSPACCAGVEMACLDACGRATGRRLCELLGGPVRDRVEFAAYLFYRYAADHPKLLADPRIVDGRGLGDKALDAWGEVRTPAAMARMAAAFRDRWGFRVFKLKAGVLPPDDELETLRAMHAALGKAAPLRIDPNAAWKPETALRIGRRLKDLPLEYYEDPVAGQAAMAEVRRTTGLTMSTNMCVTRFEHVPEALRLKPIDVVLGDHHGWGGMTAFQALGDVCDLAGWKLSQHSNNHAGLTMAAMTHVGAVVPQLTVASDTHYPWLPDGADILADGKLPIRDGHIEVPKGPGLGVTLDPDRLAKAHETYRKCGMTERDDAHTMRLIDPKWERPRF
jgi:glucarate dehydratase